jgi:hypothetical protein
MVDVRSAKPVEPDPVTRAFYRKVFTRLQEAEVPFVVGGAYALARYAGIERHTKDVDVFCRREDVPRAFEALEHAGCWTDLTFPHWLGKAGGADAVADLIFSSGNGLASVDDAWFEHACLDEVVGMPVLLCPAEEMIWQKSFIMERERFDGADVIHLIRARAEVLDWARMLRRFGEHRRVLFSHLVLFGYVYPGERLRIPRWVMQELIRELEVEQASTPEEERLCRGTFLSRAQYLSDVQRWGYRDMRIEPEGPMSAADIAHWTAAIDEP